jgi:hypothetical protein
MSTLKDYKLPKITGKVDSLQLVLGGVCSCAQGMITQCSWIDCVDIPCNDCAFASNRDADIQEEALRELFKGVDIP